MLLEKGTRAHRASQWIAVVSLVLEVVTEGRDAFESPAAVTIL